MKIKQTSFKNPTPEDIYLTLRAAIHLEQLNLMEAMAEDLSQTCREIIGSIRADLSDYVDDELKKYHK